MKKCIILLASLGMALIFTFHKDAVADDVTVRGITCFDLMGWGCEKNAVNISTPGANPGLIAFADNLHRRDIVFENIGIRLLTSTSSSPASLGIDIRENGWVGINKPSPVAPLTVNGTILMEDHASWNASSGHAGITAIGGELYGVDENGNISLLSPHDDTTGEWIFYSKNTRTGRVMRVDMERLVRSVEALTGEKFMMEEWGTPGGQDVDPSKLRMTHKR